MHVQGRQFQLTCRLPQMWSQAQVYQACPAVTQVQYNAEGHEGTALAEVLHIDQAMLMH